MLWHVFQLWSEINFFEIFRNFLPEIDFIDFFYQNWLFRHFWPKINFCGIFDQKIGFFALLTKNQLLDILRHFFTKSRLFRRFWQKLMLLARNWPFRYFGKILTLSTFVLLESNFFDIFSHFLPNINFFVIF